MSKDRLDNVIRLIGKFDVAMLVTRRDGELRSRPMAIGDHTSDGRIRFITRDDSAKLAELDEDSRVNVTMQGESEFLSISGRARLSKDDRLIDAAWSRSQAPWFQEGKDDPHVIALEVVPTYAEYWDPDGASFLELALDALTEGDAADGDFDDVHGGVDFRGKPL